LRFNYRGVGTSEGKFTEGHGELLDFRAAMDAMERRTPGLPLWAAGYSFGAWVAMTVGAADARVAAVLGIAPPILHHDFTSVAASSAAKFIIQAEWDEVCPLKTVRQYYATLSEPRELVVIEGAGHAFDGKAGEVASAIEDLFGVQPEPADG
jgi:alpha/beta superfamily hydrolase